MNKPYIIKKMYERDGKKYRDYLGGYLGGKSNHVYWVPLRTGAATFTLDEGNKTIKALDGNNFNDEARYALLVHDNENAAKPEKNTGNLYRIREKSEENFGFQNIKWLKNTPELLRAPEWSFVPQLCDTFNSCDGMKMIAMLKDQRMIDYVPHYDLVLVQQNEDVEVDDAVTAFDRAFEVL